MSQFIVTMLSKTKAGIWDSNRFIPFHSLFYPRIKPFIFIFFFTEEFNLHLLKLSSPKNKLSWCYFVSERFSNICNSKRNLCSHCSQNILKIYKYTLCCFWP